MAPEEENTRTSPLPLQEEQQAAEDQAKLERITRADLKVEIPEEGGTVIVLQRNAKDKANRKLPPDSPEIGTLDAGEAEATRQEAMAYFREMLTSLSAEERQVVDFLIMASDAT